MASTLLFLLQLLLLTSMVSASHHLGGTLNVAYKGRNPDGSFKLSVRARDTYDGCNYYHYWYCHSGNCSFETGKSVQISKIDSSTNLPSYQIQWCETENIESWNLPSDHPLQFRTASCCWRSTRNSVVNWRLNTLVDLGTRSDTREPNKSPNIAILPFIRVPQNCPRTYKLPSFDLDGDHVRCRYGNIPGLECDSCNSIPGFLLDQDSCTLHYNSTFADYRPFGFELVVEDFPSSSIDLFYSDGSRAHKSPLMTRIRRQAVTSTFTIAAPATTMATGFSLPINPSTTKTTMQTTTNPQWWTTARSSSMSTTPTPLSWWKTTSTTPTITTTSTTSTSKQTTSTPTTTPFWATWKTTMPGSQRTTQQMLNSSPLSKLPLQFAFLVDPAVPSCQEGLYLPQFVAPTPSDGQRIVAEVQKELEIRIKAQATESLIVNLIVSGPTNVSKHTDTKGEFVIRWTPVENDLGDFYHICFAVESVNGVSVYHSAMRCVLVEVRKEQIEATVTCTETAMKVEVEKASFFGLEEDHLRLSDPSNTICSLDRHSNSTHIVAIIPLNCCGTQIEEDDDYLIFKNEITTVEDDRNTLITRKHLVEARFYCQYPKLGNVTLSFSAHRKNVTVWEKGFGTFTYQFEFYQDNQFKTMFNPNSYPLEFDIGERIYMQLDASSTVNNTEMFVESCRAAPYDNPNYHSTYSIIENGCEVDPTMQIYSTPNDRQFRFSMEAFKFIGLANQVYISCTVMICESGNPNTRCSQGCINSTSANLRIKRETVVQSGMHFVSQGPLRLRRDADPRGVSAFNLNLNLVFVAGCLLVTVGMVCGVIIYKTKTSRIKYQPLPAYEN